MTPGPWIILGTNGLGKSTLLLILACVLSGAVRIRSAGFTGERSDLLTRDQKMFAVRVGDNAPKATASVTVRLGKGTFSITRRLSDLSLLNAVWKLGRNKRIIDNESDYRLCLAEAMGVAQFEDALRAIESVVFYLEDREHLVWDVSAQFELFRGLLTPAISAELRRLEGVIVSADSFSRNLNASLFKLVTRREKQRQRHAQSAVTLASLAKISAELEVAQTQELALRADRDAKRERRSDLRIEYQRAARDLANAKAIYERLKFDALRHAFAGVSPNEQYVFLKLVADKICVACGHDASSKAKELERLQKENRCVICGASRDSEGKPTATASAAQARAAKAYQTVETCHLVQEQIEQKYREAKAELSTAETALENSQDRVDQKQREVRKLRARLPSDTQLELARHEEDIDRLRREVLEARRERDDAEVEITSLLAQLTTATEAIRERLEQTFQSRAQRFFAEQVRLVYAPRRDRIGQGGRAFDFPAFEVEMTSGATGGEFVRRHPDQVSLSQREYIDLIFRMSLVDTIAKGASSIVVDGPEGSLDAVFAERAGHLFAGHRNRKVGTTILACNVVEGAFIPCCLAHYKDENSRSARLLNLFEIAEPTAALRILRKEYTRAVKAVLRKGCKA
jgi:hypothetical protein